MATESLISLTLPWPTSVNSLWRHGQRGVYMTAAGKAFRENVIADVFSAGAPRVRKGSRVAVLVEAFPPNQRKCDLDNLLKGTLDALTYSKVWEDDEQVDDVRVIRRAALPPGKLTVQIKTIS